MPRGPPNYPPIIAPAVAPTAVVPDVIKTLEYLKCLNGSFSAKSVLFKSSRNITSVQFSPDLIMHGNTSWLPVTVFLTGKQ